MTITAVGFDLDYTLVVPVRQRADLLDDAVRDVGAEPIDRQAYLEAHREHLTAETRAPIFDRLLDEQPDRDGGDRAEDLATAYREAINESLVPLDGVETMLEQLRQRYRVGLLTNGPTLAQRAKLATLGWEAAFDATVVSGELPAGKPDSAAFEALLNALGSTADETVYVGDEVEADVVGATAAGLRVVQVVFPNGPDADPRADAHVERDDLVATLPGILASF